MVFLEVILMTMYSRYERLLLKKGVTSYRVSKATGISQTVFSEWKRGKSIPKVDKIRKIADYFGVSVGYFLE